MLDVQTAFLNAGVEEDVLVKMVPGYETNDEAGVPLVMKLKKNLYGLRQSPKYWFGTMDVKLAVMASARSSRILAYTFTRTRLASLS